MFYEYPFFTPTQIYNSFVSPSLSSLSILHPPPKSPYMILLLSSLSTFLSSTYSSPLFSSHVTMSKKKIHFLCVSRSFSFYSLFPTLGLQMYFHIFFYIIWSIIFYFCLSHSRFSSNQHIICLFSWLIFIT